MRRTAASGREATSARREWQARQTAILVTFQVVALQFCHGLLDLFGSRFVIGIFAAVMFVLRYPIHEILDDARVALQEYESTQASIQSRARV